MKIDRKNLISALVIGLLFVGVMVSVFPYPLAAKRLPLAVSILGLILTVIVILQALRPSGAEREKMRSVASVGREEGAREAVSRGALMAAVGWVGGVLVSVYLLGLQFGLSFYAFLYCRLHGGKWLESITVGLGVMAFVYLIFVVLLKALFPSGLLFAVFS